MNIPVKELRHILEKNPIIHTASSDELVQSPRQVESHYIKHAMTHMSLGNTKDYEDRLFRYLIQNKRAFIGSVTGDYGLGKTSLLVYLWFICEEKNVMAIPPFCWRTLDDFFLAVDSWIIFRLQQHNVRAVEQYRIISDSFTQKSLEKEIKELVRYGLQEEDAREHILNKRREGTLRLERRVIDLVRFCEKVTPFLETLGYRGLIIFTDELQESIQNLSPEKVFSYLFELADNMQDREGQFGFMLGMPTTTKVQLSDVRSDVLDRLANHRMVIDLTRVYTSQFALELWHRFAEYFNFLSLKEIIIDPLALISLGQLTDSVRKDLGNGPRSVISAFNAAINHYIKNGTTYTVQHLIHDIKNGEIMMGENSTFNAKVSRLIQRVKDNQRWVDLVHIISLFPNGCNIEILKKCGVYGEQELKLLDDWLGQEIIESEVEGYKLIALQPGDVSQRTSYYERVIKNAVRYFGSQNEDAGLTAVKAFNNILIPYLFMSGGDHNWFSLRQQETEAQLEFTLHKNGVWFADIGGSFDRLKNTYPNRHLHLVITHSIASSLLPRQEFFENYSPLARWIFYLELNNERVVNRISQHGQVEDYSFSFVFNFTRRILDEIPVISKHVPKRIITPMFLLNLLHLLTNNKSIPAHEKNDLDYLIRQILETITSNFLNEDLKTVHGTEFIMKNHGRLLLIEFTEILCRQRYPRYQTLIKGSRWAAKMKTFSAVLQSEKYTLAVKRGMESICDGFGRQGVREKRKIVEIFGYNSVQPLQNLIQEYPSLLTIKEESLFLQHVNPQIKSHQIPPIFSD